MKTTQEQEKVLLEFNEQAYKELVSKQEAVKGSINSLVNYCEETLKIEVTNLKEFLSNPKEYTLNRYWEKYSTQFGDAPIKKEKALQLTDWEDSIFEAHKDRALKPLRHQDGKYYFEANEIKFNTDPEDFKVYLKEEDREDYENTLKFIEAANKMEEMGGKPAWYLARYYKFLSEENSKLIPSVWYFKSSKSVRNASIGNFM